MLDDAQLLRHFAENGSAEAFDELARRHLDLIYSAALRQTGGDTHLAKDATQQVLIDLARKARALHERPSIVGWLHTATRYAATTLMRTERNRRARETVSATQHARTADDASDAHWETLRPALDDALGELRETEREAVLLRYFKGHSYAAVGHALALTETAARSRVDRALERLRLALSRRGIQSTSAALATALVHGATTPMPAELAAVAIGGALAGAAGASAGTALLAGAPAGKLAALLAEILVVKTTAALLAVSIAANVALGSFYFARAEPAANHDRLADASMAPLTHPPTAAAKTSSATGAFFAERTDGLLDLTDQATLIRKMEQDGFDRESIARAIKGLHSYWYRPQAQEHREERWAKTHPWNLNPQSLFSSRAEWDQRIKERDAQVAAAIEAAGYGASPQYAQKSLSYLPAEKAAVVKRIEKDYAAISGSRSENTILWEGPGQTGQRIWPEFEKDIRAALSPEEARTYFRDHSPAAREVQDALRQNPKIDVPPETYGAMVDEIVAGMAPAVSLRKHLGDEQFLTLLEELDPRAASADIAYRAAGVSSRGRAELFLRTTAALAELRAASPTARPALAQRTYDALVREAALSGPHLAAFDATPLGRTLREIARQAAP